MGAMKMVEVFTLGVRIGRFLESGEHGPVPDALTPALDVLTRIEDGELDLAAQHWTFTGRFLDEETGLYYYRSRCHSPVTGAFLQRDPLSYKAGPSLYAYASSAPLTNRDPLGLCPYSDYGRWCQEQEQREREEGRGSFPTIQVVPHCCEAVDLVVDTNESYGVGMVMFGIGLFVTPIVESREEPGGSCTPKWEEYPAVGTGYGAEGSPPLEPGKWNDVTQSPAFTGKGLKQGQRGAAQSALEDLKDPSNKAIFPIEDTPQGGNGDVKYIRVTLESGCPGGNTVVKVIKFWVDGEGAHAEELSGDSPEIPR